MHEIKATNDDVKVKKKEEEKHKKRMTVDPDRIARWMETTGRPVIEFLERNRHVPKEEAERIYVLNNLESQWHQINLHTRDMTRPPRGHSKGEFVRMQTEGYRDGLAYAIQKGWIDTDHRE